MTTVAEYRSSRELFSNLTQRELRGRYKRSFLGWAWSMITPLATTLVYTIVFAAFLHIRALPGNPSGLTAYAIYLLCAMLPWNFFQTSIMSSVGGLLANGNLIKKTYFPRELLPAASVAANFVFHLIEMAVLLAVVVAFGNYYAIFELPFTLVIMLLTATFGLGMGLLFSILNVYYRDIEHFLAIFFLVWLYMTPVVYPINYVQYQGGGNPAAPAKLFPGTHIPLVDVFKINPMTDMTILMRSTMWNGVHPGWFELLYYAAWAFGALFVGLTVFGRMQRRLAEEL